MPGPRRDTRGIVDATELFAHVRFRRREPAPALRPYLEHYWLIDWDLARPYASHVVPHPSVNVVFQRFDPGRDAASVTEFAEVAGIGLELFTQKLEGRGRVCGIKFRPGGFRPFAPRWPVSEWTGRRVPIGEVMPTTDADIAAVLGPAEPYGPERTAEPEEPDATDPTDATVTTDPTDSTVTTDPTHTADATDATDATDEHARAEDDARVAALDAYLLGTDPRPDPQATHAIALADRIRTDRTIRRVAQLAESEGVTARSLQRLFATYVGVGPKWVILRHRIHEALERAESTGTGGARDVDWAALAEELGYSDQAHLVRDFTATVGVSPTAYGKYSK